MLHRFYAFFFLALAISMSHGVADQGVGPYVVGSGVVPPSPLVQPLPRYTDEARKARISGIVVLQCIVRKDGTPDSFKVIRSLGYGLDESAVYTIATKWRFKPGTKNGIPVDVMAVVEVQFRLPDVERGSNPADRIPPGAPTAGETVLFANFEPNVAPSRARGGWLLGKSEQGRTAMGMVGLLILPQNTGSLERIEVVARKNSGGNGLTGYLMSDNNGPDAIIESFPFEVPPVTPTQPTAISARSSRHPVLESGQRYWFVLAVSDATNDSYFWYRHAEQPWTSVALSPGTDGVLRVQNGTMGAMLRIYGSASNPGR